MNETTELSAGPPENFGEGFPPFDDCLNAWLNTPIGRRLASGAELDDTDLTPYLSVAFEAGWNAMAVTDLRFTRTPPAPVGEICDECGFQGFHNRRCPKAPVVGDELCECGSEMVTHYCPAMPGIKKYPAADGERDGLVEMFGEKTAAEIRSRPKRFMKASTAPSLEDRAWTYFNSVGEWSLEEIAKHTPHYVEFARQEVARETEGHRARLVEAEAVIRHYAADKNWSNITEIDPSYQCVYGGQDPFWADGATVARAFLAAGREDKQ